MTRFARETLIVGLRNAHAMERQAQELIERQIERTDEYPEVKARLKQHLKETRDQLARIESCLSHFGKSTSGIKDAALAALWNLAALAHTPAEDEILKNTFANNAFEHYEIAAYKSLLALCNLAGVEFAPELRASLREEEEMAKWLDEHIESITTEYLAHHERDAA